MDARTSAVLHALLLYAAGWAALLAANRYVIAPLLAAVGRVLYPGLF